MAMVDPGVEKTNIRSVRNRRDHARSQIINPFLLLKCSHLREEGSSRFRKPKLGNHAENIYRLRKVMSGAVNEHHFAIYKRDSLSSDSQIEGGSMLPQSG